MATKKPAAKKKVTTARKTPAVKAVAKKATAATTRKPAAKKAPAGKAVKKTATHKTKKMELTPEARYLMVEEEAYYLAERSGFQGDPSYFWIEAEKLVVKRLG